MTTSVDFLLLAIATPLVAALLIALGIGARAARWLAGLGFAIPAVIALYLWSQFPREPGDAYAFFSSYPLGLQMLGIKLTLGLNGISMPLFAMTAIVGLAAGLYALQSAAERLPTYLMLLLIMQAGLLGVFASIDIFFFYFFHELALIPTFIMVGIWGGRDRHYAAMKMTIYLTAGAMLSLIGLIALYYQSGLQSFDLITLRAAVAENAIDLRSQNVIFGLLMFGFGILVSLWPLHTWAPLGYGAAPSSVAMLHAGVLKKFGLYGLVQIGLPLLPSGAAHWAPILTWLALGNIIIIGLVTIAQRDLKQMVGYASVMHVGYGFLGVACLSVLGAGGVVLFMVAHGLSVALLFLLTTSIHHRTGTFDLEEMGGLVKHAPVMAAFFLTAMLASIGLPGPGLLNFWSELTIFMAIFDHALWVMVLAVLGVVISAIYGLRAVARVFYGQPTAAFLKYQEGRTITDLRWGERLPAVILLVTLIALGAWPKAISTPMNSTLEAVYPATMEVVPDTMVRR